MEILGGCDTESAYYLGAWAGVIVGWVLGATACVVTDWLRAYGARKERESKLFRDLTGGVKSD